MAKYVYNIRVEANEYEPLENLLDKAGYDSELLETYEGDEDDEIVRGLDCIQQKVYLVGFFEDYKSICEALSGVELIPENKLVEHVKTMIDEGRINPETIEDGGYDIENMDVAMAIKILDGDGYTVKEYNL